MDVRQTPSDADVALQQFLRLAREALRSRLNVRRVSGQSKDVSLVHRAEVCQYDICIFDRRPIESLAPCRVGVERGAIMDRRRFEGSVVHEGDHFDYVVECEPNDQGMTWFATVFRGAEIRGHPNGILDGVAIEHPDLRRVLNDIVGKSIRDRVGVRI